MLVNLLFHHVRVSVHVRVHFGGRVHLGGSAPQPQPQQPGRAVLRARARPRTGAESRVLVVGWVGLVVVVVGHQGSGG